MAQHSFQHFMVFYAGLYYDSFAKNPHKPWAMPRDLPDGAYIYDPDREEKSRWYRSDHTPVLLAHVPKELLTWVLILS